MGTQWTPPGPDQPTPPPAPPPPPPPYAVPGGYQAAVAQELAGFWRRLAALLIDSILVGAVSGAVAAIVNGAAAGDQTSLQGWSSALGLVLGLLYFGILWSQRGQTLGYMALSIRLVRTDGSAVGILRAMARYLLVQLSFSLCLIPAIISAFMVGMAGPKQAIHDKIVDTLVVRT